MIREDELRGDLAGLAELSRPADLHERVLRASRRAQVRTAVATVTVLAMVAAVGTVMWRRPAGAAQPVEPQRPIALPVGEIPVMPWPGAVARDETGSRVDGMLAVPDWPGFPECPSGALLFAAGSSATAGPRLGVVKAVRADVNHDGSEDLVVNLGCYESEEARASGERAWQVVAFSGRAGHRTLGQVVGTGERGIGVSDVAVDPDGSVRVVLVDPSYNMALTQTRVYAWDDGRFTQTAGPTEFPSHPAGAELSVDAQGTVGVDAEGQPILTIGVIVRNSGPLRSSALRLVLVIPANLRPAGPEWDGCVVNREVPETVEPATASVAGGEDDAVEVQCPAPALDAGATWSVSLRLLNNDRRLLFADRSVSVEVDQQPPGVFERELLDNSDEFPVS
jgi:hypothetical protein